MFWDWLIDLLFLLFFNPEPTRQLYSASSFSHLITLTAPSQLRVSIINWGNQERKSVSLDNNSTKRPRICMCDGHRDALLLESSFKTNCYRKFSWLIASSFCTFVYTTVFMTELVGLLEPARSFLKQISLVEALA